MLESIAEFASRFSLESSSLMLWSLVLITAAIVCIVTVVLSFVQQRKFAVKAVEGIPGPQGHWFKGHLDYATFDGAGLEFHVKCATEFKTCYHLWFGPLISLVCLCHPETVKVIQSSNAPKGELMYDMAKPFVGDGLVHSEGDRWFRMRKLLTPAFHFEILKPYVRVFQESTNVLLSKWSSQESDEVELFHHVSLMTLDSILKCTLSYRTDCQTKKEQDPYIAVVYEATNQIFRRLMNPLIHNDTIYKLTPDGRKFFKNCAIAHAKADGIIKARRKALQDDEEKEKLRKKKYLDFLDILLEAKDENGKGLTDEEIVGQTVTFMFAGHDTTASAVSWTLYNLARFPEHQEKCLEEIVEVFGNNDEVEWKQLGKLKYLLMCIKESCRLFAPVPVISRTLDKTYEIDGHLVPEGTFVMTNIYALHLNPHVWKDPKTFDPLRFTTENAKDMSPYAFIPFSAGPRNCIGQSFALMEVKLSLAMILRKFKLSVSPDNLVPIDDLVPDIILRAKNGIRVNISPRT